MVFDHMGLVVPSLDKGHKVLAAIFDGMRWTSPGVDPINRVHYQFGKDQFGMVYEIISPLDDDSPIAGALKRKVNLINHMAYRVSSLAQTSDHLRNSGCFPLGEAKPGVAFDGNLLQFFLSPLNFIVEVIEAPAHEHSFQ